jgi:hypothetical protein
VKNVFLTVGNDVNSLKNTAVHNKLGPPAIGIQIFLSVHVAEKHSGVLTNFTELSFLRS